MPRRSRAFNPCAGLVAAMYHFPYLSPIFLPSLSAEELNAACAFPERRIIRTDSCREGPAIPCPTPMHIVTIDHDRTRMTKGVDDERQYT
jgi:hypothetical protein